MKGVIQTPDIAKIFHPPPDIEGKKMPDTRHSKLPPTLDTQDRVNIPSRHSTLFFKSTSGTLKYLISTLDTDPPFKGPIIVTSYAFYRLTGRDTSVYLSMLDIGSPVIILSVYACFRVTSRGINFPCLLSGH